MSGHLRTWDPSASMRTLLGFMGLVIVIRAALATLVPLAPDEAYYSLWAENVQWGYYDHPPVIAWLIRLGTSLVGENNTGIRALTLVLGLAGGAGIYWLAREFGTDKRLARKAVFWSQLLWTSILGGMLFAIPDIPASFFWIFSCLCAVRAARLNSIPWWLLAGLLAGLGCLSKYTALFLAPGLLLWLLTSSRYRRQLATPGPWLAAILAIAVFAPNIVWNATHDWMTFNKQFSRIVPEGLDIGRAIKFILEQFLSLGPVLCFLAVRGAWQTLRNKTRTAAPASSDTQDAIAECRHFLVSTCAPLIIYMLIHSLHSYTLSYWLTPIYPGLTLLALMGVQDLNQDWHKKIHIMLLIPAIGIFMLTEPAILWFSLFEFHPELNWHWHMLILAVLAILVLYMGECAMPAHHRKTALLVPAVSIGLFVASESVFLLNRNFEAMGKMNGWPQLADTVKRQSHIHGASWIGTRVYQTNAYLYTYMHNGPIVAQIFERFRYPPANLSWKIRFDTPGLILDSLEDIWAKDGIRTPLENCFGQVTKLPPEYRTDLTGYRREYDLYLVSDPRKNWLRDGC